MPELPAGTVTFLFTDVQGSTRLWEEAPDAMRAALQCHDALIEETVARHAGALVRPRGEGDSRFAVFARATDALGAAAAIQIRLGEEAWPTPGPLLVRMAVHTGEADLREGDYYGSAVNRCARLRSIAHGGQVLLSQATRDLARDGLPAGVTLRDLGYQRLPDLTEPEDVFQLLHPKLRADFPPLRSLDALPNNLPLQLTSFVGRDQAITEVKRLVESARLLTLVAAGGAGKTRLALQVAADLLASFEHGAFFVDLAPVADPALVVSATAAALGVREAGGQTQIESLKEYLRERRVLLVLDNCEHLVAECATLANAVLRSCPDVRILATSREPLGIAGETTWRVPSLATPSPAASPSVQVLSQYDAVRLFVERATAVRDDFQVTNENAPAVAQLCHRLDGIPLAIELAAARLKVLTVEQICERLNDRFRLLTGGSRTALPRQQTLQALVDWSYSLLTEREQALFDSLSVFPGSFSFEAAEAVCGTGGEDTYELLDLLGGLVDKSLVTAEEGEGAARYRLSETLRQYAHERLAARGEAESLRRRHAEYFGSMAQEAQEKFRGPEQASWLKQAAREQDNLRAALAWCIEAGEAELGLQITRAMWWFWIDRYQWSEARRWLEQLLAIPLPGFSAARNGALGDLAQFTGLLGDYEVARELGEESVRLARQQGDGRLLTAALAKLAHVIMLRGDTETLRALEEEVLGLARTVGDRWVEGRALSTLGDIAAQKGELAQAQRQIGEALRIARDERDSWSVAQSLNTLGDLARRTGDYGRAGALYAESLQRLQEAGAAFTGQPSLKHNLGYVALATEQPEQAASSFREALEMFHAAGDRRGVAECVVGLAAVAVARGEAERAARLFGAAEAGFEALGTALSPSNRKDYEHYLSQTRAALGDEAIEEAWARGRTLPMEEAMAQALAGRAGGGHS